MLTRRLNETLKILSVENQHQLVNTLIFTVLDLSDAKENITRLTQCETYLFSRHQWRRVNKIHNLISINLYPLKLADKRVTQVWKSSEITGISNKLWFLRLLFFNDIINELITQWIKKLFKKHSPELSYMAITVRTYFLNSPHLCALTNSAVLVEPVTSGAQFRDSVIICLDILILLRSQ